MSTALVTYLHCLAIDIAIDNFLSIIIFIASTVNHFFPLIPECVTYLALGNRKQPAL